MIRTHPKKLEKALKEKGWESHYIERTVHIFSKRSTEVDGFLFLLTIGLVIFGSALLLTAIIPLLIQYPLWFTAVVVFVLGGAFGFFLHLLLKELEVTARHYAGAVFVILLVSTLVFVYVLGRVQSVLAQGSIYLTVNPLLITAVYFGGLFLPHLFYLLREYYASS